MKIVIKKRVIEDFTYTVLIIILLFSLFVGIPLTTKNVIGANITNETVIARVNVSNTEPTLYEVKISDPTPPIDLNPGGVYVVTCNGSVYDINGYDDISNVNATLYFNTVASNAEDDNSTHYTNSSCGSCDEIPGSGSNNGSCYCKFAVQYYANVGDWYCNMTVTDSGSQTSSENTSNFRINEVLGIDVFGNLIDYGNLSVSETSRPIPENVTNIGNIPINVTIRGYGGANESTGINFSMLCDEGANITFEQTRFTLYNDTLFADMYNLSNQTTQIINYTIPKRTNNTYYGNSTNATFWRLQVPVGVSGICNGTVIFGAVDATTS